MDKNSDIDKLFKMIEEERKGWQCPNCKKIHSPDVQSCDCTKAEDKNPDQKDLLLE